MFYIYLIGSSMQTAEWMMFGVPIYYPLGFKQHPLEGAGICIYYIPYYRIQPNAGKYTSPMILWV